MTAEDELRAALGSLASALDALAVPWAIGGSYASSVHGEPRATNDLDLVASLRAPHVQPFVAALGADFYADTSSIREAIAARDSFNVIDERSFLKVDVFVPASGAMGEGQLLRRRRYPMTEAGPNVYVLGPEDTVLQKLRWFDIGGRVSDRQWRDLVGVIRLGGELDVSYMRALAAGAALSDLLERALTEGGR